MNSEYAGLYFLFGAMLLAVGISIGSAAQSARNPEFYADGYCAALGGVRVTDEVCNVDGRIVEVKR